METIINTNTTTADVTMMMIVVCLPRPVLVVGYAASSVVPSPDVRLPAEV